MVYGSEQIDWAHYLSKRDLFPNGIQSDLPIAPSDEHPSSFKQAVFSHFHRRPKPGSTHMPTTVHSSFNATRSISEVTQYNRVNPLPDPVQSIVSINTNGATHRLLDDRILLNYLWPTPYNPLKPPLIRVRKSRIIASFDGMQQNKEGRAHTSLLRDV